MEALALLAIICNTNQKSFSWPAHEKRASIYEPSRFHIWVKHPNILLTSKIANSSQEDQRSGSSCCQPRLGENENNFLAQSSLRHKGAFGKTLSRLLCAFVPLCENKIIASYKGASKFFGVLAIENQRICVESVKKVFFHQWSRTIVTTATTVADWCRNFLSPHASYLMPPASQVVIFLERGIISAFLRVRYP